MKIQVKQLGAIEEASIDLNKPLTLFCGQNSTGKTYLSYIIYALTKNRIGISPLRIDIRELIEKGEIGIELIDTDLTRYQTTIFDKIKSDLDVVFGIGEEQAKKIFQAFELNYSFSESSSSNHIHQIDINDKINFNNCTFGIKKEKNSSTLTLTTEENVDYSDLIKENDFSKIVLSSLVYNRIAFYPITNATFLPVERNSIYIFKGELSTSRNILIDQLQKLGKNKNQQMDPIDLLQRSSNIYPLAIKDGLSVANNLESLIKKKSTPYVDFALAIEQQLLKGQIGLNKDTGGVEFTPKSSKQILPIHLTSSIVKTLSSLIFYLKYIAQHNDLVIIDEPEMNLHPDNQIVLTKIFGKMLNKGLRLIISTHSDYIIREFNNLIMASSENVSENLRKKLGYEFSETIQPKNVGVYYFHFRKMAKTTAKKVIVKQLEITNTGFDIESIDEEIDHQNNRAQHLYACVNQLGDNNG